MLDTDCVVAYTFCSDETSPGVAAVVRDHHDKPMTDLVEILLRSVREFGGHVTQADDITVVVIRRLPD